MTARENLLFFYPFLFDANDPRFVTANERDIAFKKAESPQYIPACLDEDERNEATAHYVAHILAMRWAVSNAGKIVDPNKNRVRISEKEGDTEIRYEVAPKLEILPVGLTITPHAAWRRLMNRCAPRLRSVRV